MRVSEVQLLLLVQARARAYVPSTDGDHIKDYVTSLAGKYKQGAVEEVQYRSQYDWAWYAPLRTIHVPQEEKAYSRRQEWLEPGLSVWSA